MSNLDLFTKQVADNEEQQNHIDVMARTIWGEARGEGLKGMEAVGFVIMNRYKISKIKGKFWWGNNISEICKKPYQFSCWNKKDVNYEKLINVTTDDKLFATAKRIASKLVRLNNNRDITNCADHYHTVNTRPNWLNVDKVVANIGNHIFYKLA
jgi:spore germination cell wall hydrolase CwlJ-like protein